MTFDSNLAWREASATVSANRDVLLALAGVFFMLPGLAFTIFFPQPQPAAGMDQEALMKLMAAYYSSALPFVLISALFQALGTLTLLTLYTDRSRPTVGEAIRLGVAGLLPYFGAQILIGVGFGLVAALLIGLAGASGIAALAVIVVALVIAALLYVLVKTSLVAPIVAVERERNPVAALRRSWDLTEGNSLRLGLFYLLIAVAFLVVVGLVMMVVGVVLALIAPPEPARVLAAVISSALGAVMTLYVTAILAACHRQLAGSGLGETFL